MRDGARDVLAIAAKGLAARARKDASGADERIHLAPLERIVETGLTRADELLARYWGPWKRSVEPAFVEWAY